MLAPPMRFSSRFAIVALLLFCVLLLYHFGRYQESWISSAIPRPESSEMERPSFEKSNRVLHASVTVSSVPTSAGQGEGLSAPTTPEGTVSDPIVAGDATEQAAPTNPSCTKDGSVEGVIVIGKLQSEDTSWVGKKLSKWQNAIYVVDNQSAPLHTPINKGQESMPYLTYIIENYNKLPKTLVFLHSDEEGFPGGWHTDTPEHSNVWSIEHLNLDFVQQIGYVNLRCTHIPGCPDEIQPFHNPFDPSRTSENHIVEAWNALFGNDDVPHVIGAACCAQFAVSRDQVLKRPLDDYVRYRKWILDTPLEDDLSGRIIEYLWHVIFGKPPVDCPAQDQCFWDVYRWETQFDEKSEQG